MVERDVEEVGDLSLEATEDDEVALVDGVFEGAFGALGDESWCFGLEVEALVDVIENGILSFDSAVRLNALKLKNLKNFIGSRKLSMIWSFEILKDENKCKIPFICEDGLTIVWNLKNSSEFCKRESNELVLDHEID
ncbi:hypothetical protein Tco_0543897 [Tanacetum coccineum]